MKLKFPLLYTTLLSAIPAYALASENLEVITVTSDFRENDIQNVTASVSVISEEVIEQRNGFHLEDILGVGANINFSSGASRGRFIQIRGIGERSQYSEPNNPSVGLLVDDFDFSGFAGIGTLFDVEQVEILRGPQATEFGAAGMAGTIKIKTAEANEQQQTKFLATVAQQNTWNIGAAYGNQITDKLFYRVAINQFKSDGFIYNQFLDRDDTDNLDELTARLKLKFLATDNTTIDFNYQYFDIDNGYDAFSLDNDGVTRSDEPGVDTQETHAFGIKAKIEFAKSTLIGSLNHTTSDSVYGYDEDWTYVGFHPWEYSSTDYYYRERDLTSVDLRVVSNDNGLIFDDSTQWLIGFFARDIDENTRRNYTYAEQDFTSQYEPQNLGVYGQTDTQLTSNLNLSVGLRADRFEMDYINNDGYIEQQTDTMLGGKVVLKYSINQASVYTSVSRGYKAGGFNPDQRVSEASRLFSPEYNWNYEVGIKGQAFDDQLFMRVALFYMDREDTQVSDYDVQISEEGIPSFIDIIGNADVGTNKGLEVELDWQVSELLNLTANYGYLDAYFGSYTQADGTYIDKQWQAQAPKNSFNLAAVGYLSQTVSVRLEADGKDNYRFSDGHDVESPFTVLVNAQLRLDWQDWTFSLWGKNILDREHYVRGFGGFSNDPRDGYATPQPYLQLGDGRQFGLTASLRY
ncbi:MULTISPECIES: TonB-dependent receptor [Aliiglaciecola]|uniref:TonB-dependent receptor n=1 Tax=Aliiglaciecola TaxID=1406885 RepID=UPI001C080154|nr:MULTISPECIES: TonB-dependent receptor [Aliiglaciecola]MBU2879871.1 TonB-dependent receptor [Aliiglaciecola lipolytica]MDO6709850.1 TonB-dependent receptor [Aliiglaciecola sp. 2_MG-2023]MDO6750998.1 TonB-dependent receptor [Aliiglaciecola sp. 1_MG-2023]